MGSWSNILASASVVLEIGGLRVQQIDFDHTMTELELVEISDNGLLVRVAVEITEAWEVGKTLTLGDNSDPDRVLESGEVCLYEQNVYLRDVNLRYNVGRIVKLFLSATSTTGIGKITLVYDTEA